MTSSARQNILHTHAATALRRATSADQGNADARELLPINQRRISAMETTMTKPPGAMSSVFDVQRPPKKPRAPKCLPPTPEQVKILKGIPVPVPAPLSARVDVYGDLIARMADGDMVVLERPQALAMRTKGKKLGVEITIRTMENGKTGVWRVGILASSSNA